MLYVNDTTLVVESKYDLKHIMDKFERTCDRMRLKINVGKSKELMVK